MTRKNPVSGLPPLLDDEQLGPLNRGSITRYWIAGRNEARHACGYRSWRRASAVIAVAILTIPSSANAFWLLGFSSAETLSPGTYSALAGTGGQFTSVGDPAKQSFTPFLPHAGFRMSVTDDIDIGYRLTQVAMPFSSVGPSLGGELDIRYRLTPREAPWQVAVLGGMAYSYLDISGTSRGAWSPGGDLLISHALNDKYTLISEIRDVYTAIPTAPAGADANHVNAAGVDVGMKYNLTPTVGIVPEMGLFHFTGRLLSENADGFGVQYGVGFVFNF